MRDLEKILEALEKTKTRLRANVNFDLAMELAVPDNQGEMT